jgi:hypothetical protein
MKRGCVCSCILSNRRNGLSSYAVPPAVFELASSQILSTEGLRHTDGIPRGSKQYPSNGSQSVRDIIELTRWAEFTLAPPVAGWLSSYDFLSFLSLSPSQGDPTLDLDATLECGINYPRVARKLALRRDSGFSTHLDAASVYCDISIIELPRARDRGCIKRTVSFRVKLFREATVWCAETHHNLKHARVVRATVGARTSNLQ